MDFMDSKHQKRYVVKISVIQKLC